VTPSKTRTLRRYHGFLRRSRLLSSLPMFYGKVYVHALQHRCLLTPSPSPSLYPMHPGLIIAHLGPAHVFVRYSAINLSYHRNSISVANLRGCASKISCGSLSNCECSRGIQQDIKKHVHSIGRYLRRRTTAKRMIIRGTWNAYGGSAKFQGFSFCTYKTRTRRLGMVLVCCSDVTKMSKVSKNG
jgi:hypothetical protein